MDYTMSIPRERNSAKLLPKSLDLTTKTCGRLIYIIIIFCSYRMDYCFYRMIKVLFKSVVAWLQYMVAYDQWVGNQLDQT